MVIIHPICNVIPFSGFLVLLITFWRSSQLNRELVEKLEEVETITAHAVNTSRECGKDLTNKTVIHLAVKRKLDFMMQDLKQMNGEKTFIENIEQNKLNLTKDSKAGHNQTKKKIRQNRMQMYGVKFVKISNM